MDSAQPRQSIEPSTNADTPQSDTDDELSTDFPRSSKGKKDTFLPMFMKKLISSRKPVLLKKC